VGGKVSLLVGNRLKMIDSLRIVPGAVGRAALLPQLFPIPHSGRYLDWQRESELMRQHAHLPAMVGFVREHVAQHFRTNRPGAGPAVSVKLFYVAPAAESFREHLRAAGGALGQSRTGLPRGAARAVELPRNLQMRRRKPDPLAADVVHVGKDRRNGTCLAFAGRLGRRRFGFPGGRVKMFDQHLVYAVVGEKDPDRGPAQLVGSMVLVIAKLTIDGSTVGVFTRGQGSPLLAL